MKLSLKNRFLLPVLGLIITGMSISTAVSYYKSKAALEGAIIDQVQRQVDSTLHLIDAWVHDRKLDITNLSRQKIFQTALKETFVGKAARKTANGDLKRYMSEYQFYDNIFVADLRGNPVASGNPAAVKDSQISGQAYFTAAVDGKDYMSGVSINKETGRAVFAISAPVKEEGDVVGVICGLIDMNYFSRKFIVPIKVGKTGYASIFDRDGRVIAHPEKSGTIEFNMNDYEFGRKMIARGEGLNFYKWQGLNMLAAFKTYDRMGWIVSVVAVRDEILGAVEKLSYMNVSVAACVVVLTALVILFIVHSIIKPVNRIVKGLKQAAEQVSVGTQQISASSQTLAEGASEQAASIEETSSTMEQMSAMTRQNANSSRQADRIMQEANRIVSRANGSMVELIHSMEEITSAGEQTSKIVKTIDEIAFQTNLLALNAAVEAARAGEAGAGFAVVADEVRNLAMRAADAAKDTAVLIEGTVKRVKEGSELVFSTNEAFGEVTSSSAKVGELIAEIAAASNEQAQGIEQVNSAVSQMDKVVQQNAASAEESASAAEEISTHAGEMNHRVNELIGLVGPAIAKADTTHIAGYDDLAPAGPVHQKTYLKPVAKHPEYTPALTGSEKMVALNVDGFLDF